MIRAVELSTNLRCNPSLQPTAFGGGGTLTLSLSIIRAASIGRRYHGK